MTNPPDVIEFEIEGYLEMLRDPEISERMRTRLAEKLADAQRLLWFAVKSKTGPRHSLQGATRSEAA